MKLLNIFDFGATPAINGLIVIADNKQVAGLTGEHSYPGILNGVGILEFIHQNLAKALLIVGQNIGTFQPQLMTAQQ